MRTTPLTLFCIIAALALLPEAAYAYSTLTCNGAVPSGSLYNNAQQCRQLSGLNNLFSGLVCRYELILDAVLARVYCGIQYSARPVLGMALVIYVILFGIQVSLGAIQFAGREVISRFLKIALIWAFATNASYGIGVAYNFFTDSINNGISWMLKAVVSPQQQWSAWDEFAAFRYMDQLIYTKITGPFTAENAKMTAFIGMLSFMVPPLFGLFVYFFIKSITILLRALIVYLLSISAIAFLITLSPLFLSLALFKSTFRFFEDWLRYIISFTLQIILIFGGIALWLMVIGQLGDFFGDLGKLIKPLQGELYSMGPNNKVVDSFGICDYQTILTATGKRLVCNPKSEVIILPTALPNQTDFLSYVFFNLLSLSLAAFAFDSLLKQVPSLARQLAGPSYAPQLGEGSGLGTVQLPGLSGGGSGGLLNNIGLGNVLNTLGMGGGDKNYDKELEDFYKRQQTQEQQRQEAQRRQREQQREQDEARRQAAQNARKQQE